MGCPRQVGCGSDSCPLPQSLVWSLGQMITCAGHGLCLYLSAASSLVPSRRMDFAASVCREWGTWVTVWGCLKMTPVLKKQNKTILICHFNAQDHGWCHLSQWWRWRPGLPPHGLPFRLPLLASEAYSGMAKIPLPPPFPHQASGKTQPPAGSEGLQPRGVW